MLRRSRSARRLAVALAPALALAACGSSAGAGHLDARPLAGDDAAPGGQADAADPAAPDAAPVPLDAQLPASCTLGSAGAAAFIPIETMAPGTACGGCHAAIGKPIDIAGTVYPTKHEADLCLGVTGVSVEITDSGGTVHALPTDAAGNFLDNLGLFGLWPTPWKVAVVRGSARREMIGAVTSGDCNSCHTAAGTSGTDGRILAP